jgi:excisionase family DNA binding protein
VTRRRRCSAAADGCAEGASYLPRQVARVRALGELKDWIDQSSLPAIHVGRRVRIRRSDFDRLVEHGYRVGATPIAESQAPASIWDGEVPPPEVPQLLSPQAIRPIQYARLTGATGEFY